MPIKEYTNRPSTFVQSDSTPIYVDIEYDRGRVRFPVNPETLKQAISSESVTENIEAVGEISIPQRPSLSQMTFNSFFWGDLESKNKPRRYIEWLKRWQRSKKPAHLIISRLDWFNMDVTCESLTYWINAGEENDIYFEITLKEYREYKAQEVEILNDNVVDEASLRSLVGNTTGDKFETIMPIYFRAPKIARSDINKPPVTSIIETKDDDSIVAITRRTVGDSSKWDELYENNKDVLSTVVPLGTVTADIPLETPKSWKPTEFVPPTISIEKALKKSRVMATIFNKLDQLASIFDSIKSMIEDIEHTEGAIQEFFTKIGELEYIFSPENCLDGLNSMKMALEDLKAIAEMPETAIGSLDQMINIILDLTADIAEFVSEW